MSHVPDRVWALNTLATLDPGHEFFKKSYNYERPNQRRPPNEALVLNDDELFTDLVVSSKVKKSKKKQHRSFKHFVVGDRHHYVQGRSQVDILKERFRDP